MEELSGNLESFGWWVRWVRLGRRYESGKMMGGQSGVVHGNPGSSSVLAPQKAAKGTQTPDPMTRPPVISDKKKRTMDRKIHPQADYFGVQV